VGIVTLSLREKVLNSILLLLVSFAAGTLLGDAFVHLIPESFETSGAKASAYILFGIVFFFVLEKAIKWRHCHEAGCPEHSHVMPYMILVGDGMHNLIDGIIIGASYLVSIPVGIATTLAVIFHEIPQEIGDFGTLLYGGFSKLKALLYNFLSALTAVVGTIAVLLLDTYVRGIAEFLVPFAAGGFIYIAAVDIIPELHRHKSQAFADSAKQLFFFVAGIVVMYALLFLE
jgi:zinc and cadmium transporter